MISDPFYLNLLMPQLFCIVWCLLKLNQEAIAHATSLTKEAICMKLQNILIFYWAWVLFYGWPNLCQLAVLSARRARSDSSGSWHLCCNDRELGMQLPWSCRPSPVSPRWATTTGRPLSPLSLLNDKRQFCLTSILILTAATTWREGGPEDQGIGGSLLIHELQGLPLFKSDSHSHSSLFIPSTQVSFSDQSNHTFFSN